MLLAGPLGRGGLIRTTGQCTKFKRNKERGNVSAVIHRVLSAKDPTYW